MVTSHITDRISGTWATSLMLHNRRRRNFRFWNGCDAIQDGGGKRKLRLRLVWSIKLVAYTTSDTRRLSRTPGCTRQDGLTDRLIFNMRIPIPWKDGLYIETWHRITLWLPRPSSIRKSGAKLGLYSLSGRASYRKISRSLKAASLIVMIIVSLWNFDKHLLRAAAEMPVKFQSDWKCITPNLVASRFHDISVTRPPLSEWRPWGTT